jgi:anti-anti-sigma regulatory factor
MEINIEYTQGSVPITILSLSGELDGSNFKDVISRASNLFASGTRNILLDLSNIRFMSSAGLVALHSTALILRGENPHDPEGGWNVFHAIAADRDSGSGKDSHLKLLNPQERIMKTFQKTGMDLLFEIFSDREIALASFT